MRRPREHSYARLSREDGGGSVSNLYDSNNSTTDHSEQYSTASLFSTYKCRSVESTRASYK